MYSTRYEFKGLKNIYHKLIYWKKHLNKKTLLRGKSKFYRSIFVPVFVLSVGVNLQRLLVSTDYIYTLKYNGISKNRKLSIIN